jgi:HAD superfamily hydrolase (TIGR01509 family)
LKLVCFDLGRVLVRISDGWSDAFARAGLNHLQDVLASTMRDRPTREALSANVHALEHGAITPDAFCAEAARMFGRSSAEIAATLDAYIHGAFPGAVELLDDLRAAHVRTACLSNTNQRHFELMQGWQAPVDRVLERIDVVGVSHEMKLRKPAPEIYAALEAQAGVGAAEILFFDDLPDNVAAARARGWNAEEVLSREDPVTEMRAHLSRYRIL